MRAKSSNRAVGALASPTRYQHYNTSGGVPRYNSPDFIGRSWDLVELFNAAELVAGRIGQGPFDMKGLLAISRLPQGDKRLHAVGPNANPARQFNTPAYKLLLDGSGERSCAVARRTDDPGRDFHVAGHVDASALSVAPSRSSPFGPHTTALYRARAQPLAPSAPHVQASSGNG